MKTFPTALQTALTSGVTTLCHCWKATLSDGSVLGFTDHDRTLSFDGTAYEPESGFTASEIERNLGLAVDTEDVQGALSSERIAADDIALGKWDNAVVELWLVDWTDVAIRVLLRKASIGEINRDEIAFKAELRGLAHALDQEVGRTYQRQCDCRRLGDERCRFDLETAGFSGTGAVTAVDEDRIVGASGLDTFADAWFQQGLMTWTSGLNAGIEAEIRQHVLEDDGTARLTLWRRAALPVAIGDAFTIVAGCDRTFPTCQEKFANIANFRGFPHMVGDDFALWTAKKDEKNDGGSFFNG
jgi:uncharacterized phage protein (TIGR02218 family)